MNPTLEETKKSLKVKTSTANPAKDILDNFDPEILDFVVVLNHLGFNTYSSCQGHVTENLDGYIPYVLICSKEAEEIHQLNPKNAESIFITEYYKMLETQSKLIEYLDEFYLNRITPIRNRLVLNTSFFCRISITPYFSTFANTIDSKEERIKLNTKFLEEINAFTKFLETKVS
tara:strand:- start:389 stop:910 length:522 start_codon:yes stop_codon:yes gene_type:complete